MRWRNFDVEKQAPASTNEHVSVYMDTFRPLITAFQACRGSKLDEGVDVPDSDDSDGKPQRIPRQADCLYAYSTIPGQSF